jgi:hypothetical protein
MIYTVQVALVCAGSLSAVAAAVLLLYRKRISKPEEVRLVWSEFRGRSDAEE